MSTRSLKFKVSIRKKKMQHTNENSAGISLKMKSCRECLVSNLSLCPAPNTLSLAKWQFAGLS